MQREAMLPNTPLEAVTLAELALTVIASAFNAGFFINYASALGRRKIGAFALVLINLAFFIEGIYFLSPASRDNLADHIAKVLDEFRDAFLKEAS